MRVFLAAFSFLFPMLLRAADDLTVLKPGPNDAPPNQMLYTYLLGQARKHFDARRQAIAALKTPEDVQRRQTMLRAEFLKAIGGLPERTPLNPRVVGKLNGPGYRVEKVIYESRPNHHVTAVLFLAESKGPFPGVLLPCGHDPIGKANDSYQRAMISLARNGIAAMSYDPIGQGERYQLINDTGKPTVGGNTVEHTLVGIGALLVGQNTATYRIWDGIRSLDYLASRPEIDPKRIGCTGCSGGGTLTSYLMALDDRIQVAAPSCYVTSLEKLFATIGPQDAEQNITGQVAFGMEHADYLHMRIPRPTLLLTATRDFFNIDGSWSTFREAKQVYGLAGHGERVDLFESNTGHGYPKPQREAMVRFMRRWLLNKDDAPTEGNINVFKGAELQCTRTGQVLEDFKGKSAFALNAERERALAAERSAFLQKPRKEVIQQIRGLLAIPAAVKKASHKEVGKSERNGYTIRKLVFETEPGIDVPALLFEVKKGRPLVVYVNGLGKAADAAVSGPIEKLINDGYNVLAPDLRGWGETAPAGNRTSAWMKYFGPEWKEAFLGLHINRPLLGQRVYDLLSLLGAAMDEKCRVHLIGVGAAGPTVLHAALFQKPNGDDDELTLDGSLASWASVVKTPVSHEQLANVVPGVLRYYDLPQLAALAAPWKVKVRNAVDGVGKPVAQAAPVAPR